LLSHSQYIPTSLLYQAVAASFLQIDHENGLRNLSKDGILILPLYPPARKGVHTMSVLLDFIISIAAGMVGNYISKWLDGWMNRR